MLRRLSFALVPLLALTALFIWRPWQARAQVPAPMQWIWFDEGNPLADAPAETRYFRRTFDLQRPTDKSITAATLEITADNRFVVSINGKKVGQGDNWAHLASFNVLEHLVNGKNVISVAATNEGGPAGLVVRLRYKSGKRSSSIVSDSAWKVAKTAAPGWEKIDFDDSKWSKVRVLGAYGKVGPWGGSIGGSPGVPPQRKFTVPAGYKVELAVKNPGDRGPFSLVNMTFDGKGRLFVSQEGGPTLICANPDKDGVLQDVRDYCTLVTNCHGMCWVKDSLYLVGNGPKGTGLYRCRDTKQKDEIDEATLIHRFDGGMGEHGPHAVVHGPDDKLYVCIGNHAHARIGPKQSPNPEKLADNSPLRRWPTGGQGPDQGQKGSTEDVLLPRLNDANGHAANIRAPGGTIWRMDLDGKNMALVAAGFRNQFDAAFSPNGELFSFDSDMEWDEGLPWYRPVRVVHCPPGAELGWRTGASKIPPHAIDTLPPLYDTGRGSPVGVTFCDNRDSRWLKYEGAFFMADWSLGVIYAVPVNRKGASYQAKSERFCVGSPMNVTDLEFGPDTGLYFTVGGRGTQGGVYRIVPVKNKLHKIQTILSWLAGDDSTRQLAYRLLDDGGPLSAWGRAKARRELSNFDRPKNLLASLASIADSPNDAQSMPQPKWRLRALTALQLLEQPASASQLMRLAKDKDADIRAHAVSLIGVNGYKTAKDTLIKCLSDKDALVRRRACESLIRLAIEPDISALWPLLAEDDRFVRTAARLVLQRIEPKKWVDQLAKQKDLPAWEGIIALCKTGQADDHADAIFARLKKSEPKDAQALLGYLRILELACCHVEKPPAVVKEIAKSCDKLFPHDEKMVNRELAVLLTHFRRTKVLDSAVHGKLLDAIESSKGDRQQQIHYFYCLRLLHDGWTKEQKARLVDWFEQTKSWSGGNSFNGFLANIFREALTAYTVKDRMEFLTRSLDGPSSGGVHVARVLLQRLAIDRQPEALGLLKKLKQLANVRNVVPPPIPQTLRGPLDEAFLRTVLEHPKAEYFSDLVDGLSSPNKLLVFDALVALKKLEAKPKLEDGKSFRALLVASSKLDAGNKWKAVELLRHWTNNKQFGAEKGEWKPELLAWSKWFGQTFPKEPALPDVEGDKPTPSKYKYDDLLEFLTKGAGRKGHVKKGRAVFEKGQCLKCHKYGKEGEGLGPDLTTLSKRFKRVDVLESIYYPSKVISDQYRSSTIVTLKGQRFDGLAAVQGDTITVLQNDGTKVSLRKKDVEQQYASLISVMPEKLLDPLTKEEIADLFAFLESDPGK